MTDRYIVVDKNDERVPEYERDDFGWAIIDSVTGEFIGCDGGEPEDQLLVRDWSWVAPAMNAIRAQAIEECIAICERYHKLGDAHQHMRELRAASEKGRDD
jgi:hypothetical protein